MNVLLRWIIELVLSGAAEALLETRVGPQTHHCRQQLGGERLCVLHAADHVTHHLCISLKKHDREASHQHPDGKKTTALFEHHFIICGGTNTSSLFYFCGEALTWDVPLRFGVPQGSRLELYTLTLGNKNMTFYFHANANDTYLCLSVH